MWSRNLKNEATWARFEENDKRKLGVVSWREADRIRMVGEGDKGSACPFWILESHEEEEKKRKRRKRNNNNNNNTACFGVLRRCEYNIIYV